jgi:hypothetical protein
MAKSRSPEYPAIGLLEAIERVEAVYNRGVYRSPLTKQSFAEHMGYKSLSGASLPVLSALGKFGLIEGRGDDTRISELAVNIIAHQPGSPERGKAIRDAAAKPELFAELDRRTQGGKTTDQAIRSYLLTRGFIPPAADAAIRAYRETKTLVGAESDVYESPGFEPDEAGKDGQEGEREADQSRAPRSDPIERPQLQRRLPVSAGSKQDVFSLPEGEVVLQWPEPLSPESYEDFESWLNLVLRKVKRSVREPGKNPSNPPAELSQANQPTSHVSFMISQEQKTGLRERGYNEDQIGEMKPDDAHRALGIVN